MSLGLGLILFLFNKVILMGSLPASMTYLDTNSCPKWWQLWVSSYGVERKSNQKMIGYSHDVGATNTPGSLSCKVSHYCNSKHPWLGNIDNYFPSLITCIIPSRIIKVI